MLERVRHLFTLLIYSQLVRDGCCAAVVQVEDECRASRRDSGQGGLRIGGDGGQGAPRSDGLDSDGSSTGVDVPIGTGPSARFDGTPSGQGSN